MEKIKLKLRVGHDHENQNDVSYLIVKAFLLLKSVVKVTRFKFIYEADQLILEMIVKAKPVHLMRCIKSEGLNEISQFVIFQMQGIDRNSITNKRLVTKADIEAIIFNKTIEKAIDELILYSLSSILNFKYQHEWADFMDAEFHSMDDETFIRRIEIIQSGFRHIVRLKSDAYLVLKSIVDYVDMSLNAINHKKKLKSDNTLLLALFLKGCLNAESYDSINEGICQYAEYIRNQYHDINRVGNAPYLYLRFQTRKSYHLSMRGFDLVFNLYEPYYRRKKDLLQLFLLIVSFNQTDKIIKTSDLENQIAIQQVARESLFSDLNGQQFKALCREKQISCSDSIGILSLTLIAYLIKDSFEVFKTLQKNDQC